MWTPTAWISHTDFHRFNQIFHTPIQQGFALYAVLSQTGSKRIWAAPCLAWGMWDTLDIILTLLRINWVPPSDSKSLNLVGHVCPNFSNCNRIQLSLLLEPWIYPGQRLQEAWERTTERLQCKGSFRSNLSFPCLLFQDQVAWGELCPTGLEGS